MMAELGKAEEKKTTDTHMQHMMLPSCEQLIIDGNFLFNGII